MTPQNDVPDDSVSVTPLVMEAVKEVVRLSLETAYERWILYRTGMEIEANMPETETRFRGDEVIHGRDTRTLPSRVEVEVAASIALTT